MDSGACRSRAAAQLSRKLSRVGAACAAGAADLTAGLDGCITSTLDEITDGGRCAARKLAASSACFRSMGSAPGADSDALCGSFARAGTCAGTCEDVYGALEACAQTMFGGGGGPALPPPGADELVVAFGSYEGDTISTTSVVGQDDVTDSARVVIEPGTTPLYVVLSSYESTIWRFEGAIGRVRHVAMLGYGRQGATGIDADLVVDLTSDGATTPLWYDVESSEAGEARSAIESALGRSIDVFAGAYEVGTLTVPSAVVTVASPSASPNTPPGFDPWTYMSALWFTPGGLVDVDPSGVVPLGHAERYVVLPQEFGLAALVASGDLERRDSYFYIARPIPRFPAGLYGAHAVSFVLGRGVPMPDGNPGHSCVVSEETGLPVEGTLCWSFPPPPATTCDMPAANADDRVVLFGGYEGDAISTATVSGQDETTGTVRVVVDAGASPLYVVLSAFDSTIWRFEGATSRVRRVVLVGVRTLGVTGIASDKITDLTQWVSSMPDAKCFTPFWDSQSPEGVAARGAVERALGRTVDVVAASYEVGTLTLPAATVAPTPPAVTAPLGFDPTVWVLATWFNPGGVVDIEPSAVVPAAERYVVLPEAFGLAELVASGDLQLRDGSAFLPTFYIARAIPRFPAGLYGAEAVGFILGRGVPMPDGDPGHSCVVSEETGLPLANDILCPYVFGN